MSTPLVSVLMTAYNREKFIAEAIESVLCSSYSDFELIIVDDCSADATVDIAKSYAKKDGRIKVYRNTTNLGDYNNRNMASSYASGKYIKYLDSDDTIYPHGLEILVSSLEKFTDAAIGLTSMMNQSEKPFPFRLTPAESYYRHFFVTGTLDCGPSAMIFRTDVFREFNGFSGKRYVGDIELSLKIAARYPVAIVNSSLVYWRVHAGQEMAFEKQAIEPIKARYEIIREAMYSNECPLNDQQKKECIDYYKKITGRGILNTFLKRKRPIEAIKMYKAISLKPVDILNAIFFIGRR